MLRTLLVTVAVLAGIHARLEAQMQVKAEEALQHITKFVPTRPDYHLGNFAGTVIVHVELSKAGKVESLRILKGHPMLNGKVIEAVKDWEFEPFRRKNKPVAAKFDLVVTVKGSAATTLDDVRAANRKS